MISTRVLWPLLFLAVPLRAAEPQPAPAAFPPPPPAEERQARNPGEQEAGAVLLEAEIQVYGKAHSGFWVGSLATRNDHTVYRYRYRYLALDEKGVDTLSHHAFFGTSKSKFTELKGRTLTPDGREFKVDPEKDVQTLDIRDPKRGKETPIRTVVFPHLEPGAVLDLSYTEDAKGTPDFEAIPLQLGLPIRQMRVEAISDFFKPWVWVPFFVGPTPPRASARIDADYRLSLVVADVPAAKDERWQPSVGRATYYLGLMPTQVTNGPGFPGSEGAAHRVLFGVPSATAGLVGEGPIQGVIDPSRGLIQLDDLDLQVLSEWTRDADLLSWWQKGLESTSESFVKFFRKDKGVETAEDLARIAPPDLPAEARAQKIFTYARDKVKPDSKVDNQKNLRELLRVGKGSSWDLALYYRFLLERAGIPAKILITSNRFKIPYNPVFHSWRLFSFEILVRVDVPGKALYVIPGDPYATFKTFPTALVGAPAFEEPTREGDPWTVVRIPTDIPRNEDYRIDMRAPAVAGEGTVELEMASTLTDAASYYFRWQIPTEPPAAGKEEEAEERRAKPFKDWLDRFTGLELKGRAPQFDPKAEPDRPLYFTLKADWKPVIQEADGRLLLPCLPTVDLLRNPFTAATRQKPIWLDDGRYALTMTWELPPGATPGKLPSVTEIRGPGGLVFSISFAGVPPQEAGKPYKMTTTVEMNVPCFIPAAQYAETRTFYEAVQRASETRLVAILPGAAAP